MGNASAFMMTPRCTVIFSNSFLIPSLNYIQFRSYTLRIPRLRFFKDGMVEEEDQVDTK